MRKIAIVLSLFTVLSSAAYAQDALSVWRDSTITIDGKSKDWQSFLRFYISGAKAQFDFCNDSSYLYICIKASDMNAQARLLHAGIDIWFDPTGKKKTKTGISFPQKLERAPGDQPHKVRASSDPSSGPTEKSVASRLREHVIFAQTSIKVIGMIGVTEQAIPMQNKYGIDIAYDWDSLNILSIEYKIPLTLILQHPVQASDLDHPMGLGIVVGAEQIQHESSAPMPSSAQGGQRGGGMNGGAGGRGGNGGRSGGGVQNNLANDRFSNDGEQQKVWLKIHLESKSSAQ